ncbi:phage baseplate assembly protein V [Zavarzinella formosa]|uniref:phage baseplate assembly protein V n=1 Tax=Zavarzinella formosa TaxID=360055 RepID=UPI00138B0B38|nr:phage baseplate assembly protein V [Zavarzinella formosa]
MQNIMRREAARQAGEKSPPRRGIVSAYDPDHYAAKVVIQPEGHETGFIPVGSPMVGDGWGMFCPPTPGDEVDVHFQEGGKNAAYVSLRFFGNQARPLSVPSGEFWLVHRSGSFLKFLNDGTVELNTAGDLNATVGGQANLSVTGKVVASASEFDLTGDLNVTGTITASGDIYDNGRTDNSMNHIRAVYDTHTHGGIQAGGGNTAAPNQPL